MRSKILFTFHKDGTESEEGSPSPSQSQHWSQSKGIKTKKAVLNGVHSRTKNEDPQVTHFPKAQDTAALKAA